MPRYVLPKDSTLLYKLDVGDKFTTTLNRNKVFEITGRKGDTTYVKEVATGKTLWWEHPDTWVVKVDESATYQKKRFKEPYYMYESVNQAKVNTADGLYDWMTEYMRKHSSNRFTSLQFILGNGNNIIIAWDMKSYKGIHEGSKDYTLTEFVYKFMDPIIKQSGISDIYEADMNTGRFKAVKEDAAQKIVIKTAWGVEVKDYKAGDPIPAGAKFKIFNAKDTDKIEAYADSLFELKKVVENKMVWLTALEPGEKFVDNVYGKKRTFEVVKHDNNNAVHCREVGTGSKIIYDEDYSKKVEKIEEGRIAKGYENLTADERAKHLLSHPTSKYMSDLKSENITERAIRKAVKEMLGKPDKDDPQFIIDVNEECGKVQESFLIVGKLPYDDLKQAYISYSDKGLDLHTPEYKKHATRFSSRQEAQKVLDLMKKQGWKTEKFEIVQEEGEAPATTTANVATPELPMKLKESYKLVDQSTGSSRSFSTIEALAKFIDTDQGLLEFPLKTDSDIEKWNAWQKRDMGKDALQIVKEGCSKKKKKVQESLSSKNHKFTPDELKVGKRVIDKVAGKEVHGKITVNHHDLYKDNPYTQDKKGSTVVTITTDSGRSYDVDANDNGGEFILEDAENLENSFKYQISVAGGMGSDAENAESAKEHEENTSLLESIIKKTVKKKLTESAGQRLNITLIRKPQNMKEVERDMRKGYGDRVKAVVDKSYNLSGSEYDKFVYNFMVHTTYLSGEGGVDPDGTVHVIEITGPNRKTIYVDPEGFDYARYVGW